MSDDQSIPEQTLLDESELGTKEYWDAAYAREIHNFVEDEADEGTVWFSESSAEEVVLAQLNSLARRKLLDKRDSRFLDLGTGNGHMLFALREDDDDGDYDDADDDDDAPATEDVSDRSADAEANSHGWTGDLVGVDYSQPSIELARRIAASRSAGDILFEKWDLLSAKPGPWFPEGGFDAVLDKGTFDAISLMPTHEAGAGTAATARADHPCSVYRRRVVGLVKPGAFLVITSCNWTRSELVGWIEGRDEERRGELALFAEAKYPTFTFGGKTGQSIVTLVFRRAR